MRVLVTGAAGRVGRVVCADLLEAGHDVHGVDRKFENLPGIDLELVDLTDTQAVYNLIRNFDAVVHLANWPGPYPGFEIRIHNDNTATNMNVFHAAADRGVNKLVFASSIHAFTGERTADDDTPSELAYLPLDGDSPQHCGNAYGLSKIASEWALEFTCRTRGLNAVAIRFPWLATLDSRKFRRHLDRGGQPRPLTRRIDECFTWLALTDGAALIRTYLESDLPGYHVFFPAAPTPSSEEPIEQLIRQHYPDVPWRESADRCSLVDISEITAKLGWTPRVADLTELREQYREQVS